MGCGERKFVQMVLATDQDGHHAHMTVVKTFKNLLWNEMAEITETWYIALGI